VQEAWLRLSRSGTSGVDNLGGWLVNGAVGLVWAPGGRPRVVFRLTITGGKIVEIHMVADPERLRRLDLSVLHD
jgi:hypothetical protein